MEIITKRKQKTPETKPETNYNDEKMSRKSIKKVKSKKSFLFYGSIFSVSCFFIIAYQLFHSSYKVNSIDKIAHNLGLHTNVYAVIIDAGSTGSRILSTSFYKSSFDGSLKLFNDLFVQNKPGLSSFADAPEKGADKIKELIEKAKTFVPEREWSKTPIALRATAGLRLLPIEKAEALLREVRKIVDASPFVSNKDAVSIMDGQDEGLYSWFTVNFYLDNLSKASKKSVLTLDLGGGSVQITFIPKTYKRIVSEASKFMHPVSIMQNKIDMYSYSYLGLGLMAARNKVFLAENSETSTVIESSCVHPSVKNRTWNYGGITYSISGKPTSVDIFHKCDQIVKSGVEEENVDKAPEIFDREVVAFSYFFDRAAQSGIVDSDGGTRTILNFKAKAKEYCSSPKDRPFMCLDLTFIASLLENGFGLKPETPIVLIDTVDGHEISWALGAAYSILSDKLSK